MSLSDQLPNIPSLGDPFVDKLSECTSVLFEEGSTVLVALSGGPDSCALLTALKAMVAAGESPLPGDNIKLVACHVNHGLRGEESDGDEEFCKQLCNHFKIPLHAKRIQAAASDEATLREARYAALIDVAESIGATQIATAHTLDDQAETVLFRLFRGSSTAGLVAMSPSRDLTGSIRLVRPMLSISRPEIKLFLSRAKLNARQDSSNCSLEYGRNYIRQEIVPKIIERFPVFQLSIERMRSIFKEDNDLIDELAKLSWSNVAISDDVLSLSRFEEQPISIKRRIVVEALRVRNVEVTFERTAAMLKLAQERAGALSLDRFWVARADSQSLYFEFLGDSDEAKAPPPSGEFELSVPGFTLVSPLALSVQIDELKADKQGQRLTFPSEDSCEAVVDLKLAALPLVARMRRAGDIIQPFGMNEKVKLKKYLHTHKSSSAINPMRCLVIADANEVLWVPGVGLSEILRVNDAATHRVRVSSIEVDSE